MSRVTGTYAYFGSGWSGQRILFLKEDVQGGLASVVQSGALRTLLSSGKFQGDNASSVGPQTRFAVIPALFVRMATHGKWPGSCAQYRDQAKGSFSHKRRIQSGRIPPVPPSTAQFALNSSKSIRIETVLAFLGCAISLMSLVVLVDRPPINERTDFSVTYLGSRMVYLGLGPKLYDLAEQQKLKSQLLPNAEPLIYEHPPFEALLLVPLGALPYKTAFLIWGIINVAIWLFLPYLLRPYAPVPRDDLGYLLLWLLFLPLGGALFEGQSSLLMLLLYSITFIHLRSGRDFSAGAIFGLALFKFQFALPFVLIILLQRKWRFIKGFLGTATALGVLSLIAVGWRGIVTYIHLLMGVTAHPDNSSYGAAKGMATIQGFVYPLLAGTFGHAAVSVIVAAVSVFLILWTAWHWKKAGIPADLRTFDLMFAVTIVVSLVTSLHMFTPDLSTLIITMLLVARYFPERGHTFLRLVLGTTLVMFWMPPLFLLLLARHWVYLWFPVLMMLTIGIFKLAGIPAEKIPSIQIVHPTASLAGVLEGDKSN